MDLAQRAQVEVDRAFLDSIARVAVATRAVRKRDIHGPSDGDGRRNIRSVLRSEHAERQDAVANFIAPRIIVVGDAAREGAADARAQRVAGGGQGTAATNAERLIIVNQEVCQLQVHRIQHAALRAESGELLTGARNCDKPAEIKTGVVASTRGARNAAGPSFVAQCFLVRPHANGYRPSTQWCSSMCRRISLY